MLKYTYCFTGLYWKARNMDLLIGIVLGLVIALAIYGIRRLFKKDDSDSQSSSSDKSPDRLRQEESTRTYAALVEKFEAAVSRSDYEKVLSEVKSKQSKLLPDDYDRLVPVVKNAIEGFDIEAAKRAAVEPKLAAFRTLQSAPTFDSLHRIYLEEDGIITIDEIDTYGEEGEAERLHRTYDALLLERLRELILTARAGTVGDYKKVTTLIEELGNYNSHDDEDVSELIGRYFTQEWNEMIVRFKRNLDVEYDLFGMGELDEEAYKEIIKKAWEGNDLLSLALFNALSDYSGEFTDVFVEMVGGIFQEKLDAQLLAAGFKPGEEERSV